MTVQQLIEDLKQAPPESLVCFEGNGIWAAAADMMNYQNFWEAETFRQSAPA